jgi:hypothetical protein
LDALESYVGTDIGEKKSGIGEKYGNKIVQTILFPFISY